MFKKACNYVVNRMPVGKKDKENLKEGCHVVGTAAGAAGKGLLRAGSGLIMGVFGNARDIGPENPEREAFLQMDQSNYEAEKITQFTHTA